MGVQIVEIAGQKMAILPVEDFDRLLELAEDREDIMAAERAEQRRLAGDEYVPGHLVNRIMNGENPLRVWRQHRGLTLKELSEVSNVSLTQISDMERRTRKGRPAQWHALADALNVTVDDILPDE